MRLVFKINFLLLGVRTSGGDKTKDFIHTLRKDDHQDAIVGQPDTRKSIFPLRMRRVVAFLRARIIKHRDRLFESDPMNSYVHSRLLGVPLEPEKHNLMY